MKKAFRFLFNLYPGEGKKAILFLFLGFFWGVGSYGSLTLSEGLFIEKIGANFLPRVYLLSAFFISCSSFFILHSLSKKILSPRSIFFLPVIGMIILNFYFLLNNCFDQKISSFLYIYRILTWSLTILSYAAFWNFIDQFFNLQDGKRFFCIFNSITFLGDALGSGSVSWLITTVDIKGLLILFLFCHLCVIPILFFISSFLKDLSKEHDVFLETDQKLSFKKILKIIVNSKFTITLLIFYCLMQLLAIFTECNYLKIFENFFTTTQTPHSLIKFFSFCNLWISLGNMFFALFLYSRLVKKIGVNNIIVIAPACFLILFSFWLKNYSLVIGIMGMIAREGLTYTLDDNNLQLLVSGVPNKIRNYVRISIESFIEPLGMIICSSLCILLAEKQILFCLFLSIVATLSVLFLRYFYPKAIFNNLTFNSIFFDKDLSDWLKELNNKDRKKTVMFFLSLLKSQSQKEQFLAFRILLKIDNSSLLSKILNHISKFSYPNKLLAIELIGESQWASNSTVLDFFEKWNNNLSHSLLKNSILLYLAKNNLLTLETAKNNLNNPHIEAKIASIYTLKNKTDPLSSIHIKAEEKLTLLLESPQENDILAGIKVLEIEKKEINVERLLNNFIPHYSLRVQREASKVLFLSIRNSKNKKYAIKIVSFIEKITDSETRINLLKSLYSLITPFSLKKLLLISFSFKPKEQRLLENIALSIGQENLHIFIELLTNENGHDKVRLTSSKILNKLAPEVLRKKLSEIITKEVNKAHFYLYHMTGNHMQKRYPEYDLSLLPLTFKINYDSTINFMIQLLSISESIDSNIIISSLKSKNSKTRAQAIESLEKYCSYSIFSLIEPLIREKNLSKNHNVLTQNLLSLDELLNKLSETPVLLNQIVSKKLKATILNKNKKSKTSIKTLYMV